jgi:3-oxoacyl-[acyl-carrier protein] reductase
VPDSSVPTPDRRVAVVTGANHGIGAATAVALARAGVDVLVTYLRLDDDHDPGVPPAYGVQRAAGADEVLSTIESLPGRGAALEQDLTADGAPARIFDDAERRFGPVSILVNNAAAGSPTHSHPIRPTASVVG